MKNLTRNEKSVCLGALVAAIVGSTVANNNWEKYSLPETPAIILEERELTKKINYSFAILKNSEEANTHSIRTNSADLSKYLIQRAELRINPSFTKSIAEFNTLEREYQAASRLLYGGVTMAFGGALVTAVTYFCSINPPKKKISVETV